MDEIFRDFLVTFIIVAAIFGIFYVYFMTRHREKLILLEKGMDASEFYAKKDSKWISLKYGMLLIGLSLGILIGNIVDSIFDLGNIICYLSMTFLFGGLNLILYFLIEKKYKK